MGGSNFLSNLSIPSIIALPSGFERR